MCALGAVPAGALGTVRRGMPPTTSRLPASTWPSVSWSSNSLLRWMIWRPSVAACRRAIRARLTALAFI